MENKHLKYLDNLRSSGKTNMFGAKPFLMSAFPELEEEKASEILEYWMTNFDENGTRLPSKYSNVPKCERHSYYKIFTEMVKEVNGQNKIRWHSVGCDWRCLYAEGDVCTCSCHGKNHKSLGLQAIAEEVLWNWPQILKDYLLSFQNEDWTGNFKIKVNWSLLKGKSVIDLERDLERKGLEYDEKLKSLMEIAEIDEYELESCKTYIRGKIKDSYRKRERVLNQPEKISALLALGLEKVEKSVVLEEKETLEEEYGIKI